MIFMEWLDGNYLPNEAKKNKFFFLNTNQGIL